MLKAKINAPLSAVSAHIVHCLPNTPLLVEAGIVNDTTYVIGSTENIMGLVSYLYENKHFNLEFISQV